jgi:hypothetical protein
MSDSKIETSSFSTNSVERRTSPEVYNSDDAFYSIQNPRDFEITSQTKYGTDDYQRRNSDVSDNALINWEGSYQRSSSTNEIISTDAKQDTHAEHIRRHNNNRITYRQDVSIRYLQPPTPPPPDPVIIREIYAPQLPEPPPLVIRQRPPALITPPPIVIRERPPIPPPIQPPRIVTKYLPAPPPSSRRVVIERQAPLPQKPRPIIIEKWLPYKPPSERRVVVQRAQPLMQRPVQRNTVITYDPPHVDVVKNVRNLGTVRVDPHMYSVQYGSQFSSSEYVRNTMTKFGLGNNYSQMIQMQTSPRSSEINNNHWQAIDSHFNNQQTMTYGEPSTGDHCEYIEKHKEETILRDGHRSSIDGSNEQEVLRQAEISNYD